MSVRSDKISQKMGTVNDINCIAVKIFSLRISVLRFFRN